MTPAPSPERIAQIRARMAEIGRATERFRDGLRETNDESHHAYFAPLLGRLDLIVANEQAGITLHLADNLTGARSALRRLPLPDIDPALEAPTMALELLRGRRGNLIEALDNALEAAQALGMEPALTELGELRVPRNAFANALIRLDERLRVVQDAVTDLAGAAAKADADAGNGSVSQTGLVNVHVRSLTVEVSAARFETRIGDSPEIPELSDLSVLARSVEDMREVAGDLKQLVDGLGAWVADGVKAIGGVVARATERSGRGVRTVVSLIRRRLAGAPDRKPTAPVPAEDAARELDPLAWAAAEHERGDRLFDRGEKDPERTLLEQAVAAYRAALVERTRERVPEAWAATQHGLGKALVRLGERESGTARLEEAVAAFRGALLERTRERVPLDWAATQNYLGNALWRLGARESGTARLEEAVAAFRAALLERTRERVPLDWATTQINLGNALARLGGRKSGTARLKEAVAALRAALLERSRERVPLEWAATQNYLGVALAGLGARERGTARLEEAVAAYRAALLERTRERVPLDWAATQNNLGAALHTLGERESGTARLEEAVAAYRAALQEYTRERVPLNWAFSQHNLANALAILAQRRGDRAQMTEAITAMRNAAEVYREGNNTYWLPIAERRIAEMEAALQKMS